MKIYRFHHLVALFALAALPRISPAQVTVDQLAKPSANAQAFTIVSTAAINAKALL